MYSWQIDEILRSKNYLVDANSCKAIIDSSQICHAKYDPYDNTFLIETNDGYSWRFKTITNIE